MAFRSHMRNGTCFAALIVAAWPSLAAAQSEPASGQRTAETAEEEEQEAEAGQRDIVEERSIVVSGNRFQKLLDQPQPKAIISAEDRNLAGVNTADELIRSQPGFNITSNYGISVRGIGRQSEQTLLGQENTVIQYVDGFINLVPSNIGESTLFGGNVTFLRGPAGTTYGRNAIAGAVNVISRAPTPELTAQAVAGTGRGGAYNVGASIAGPITSNLGFRVGAQRFVQPSIFKAVGGAKGAGFAVDNTYIEFQLEWRLGAFHIRNRATTFQYDNQPAYPSLPLGYNNALTAPVFGALSPNAARGFTGTAPTGPFQTNVNFVGYDRLRDNFQNITNADLDLGFATLFYVGGYQTYLAYGSADRDLTSRTSYDGDTVAPGNFAAGTQVPTDYRTNYYNDNSFSSHELRLESKPGDISWVLGAYYFDQEFDEQYWESIENGTDPLLNPIVGTVGLPTPVAPNPRRAEFEQRNIYDIESQAIFGNVTWDITPTLRFDGGLRHTWDQKEALTDFRYIYYYPPFYAADFSPIVSSANPQRDDKGLSGRAALAWRPGPGDQLYVSYARGYQSSAFTLGQGLPGPDPANPRNIADKEFLDVYEIGGNLTAGPVRFDGSVFYQKFHDAQIPVSARGVFVGPNGPAPGPIFRRFVNAEQVEIYGAEGQVSWRPNELSNIVASYTYLHPVFDSFCPLEAGSTACGVLDIGAPAGSPEAGVLQDLSGNEYPRTPRHKASLYGYYGIDMGAAGKLFPGGSVYYQSSQYTTPFTVERYRVPGRTLANVTMTYRTANDRLDLTAVVSNVFRKRYSDYSDVSLTGGGEVNRVQFYGADRYWTLTARYRF